MARPRLGSNGSSGRPRVDESLYFEGETKPFMKEFIPSGSALLDCLLGGGWPLGRISNIVGDRSTGKTLIAIEAAANFLNTFSPAHAKVYYIEAEAAFDKRYAASLGMPIRKVEFPEDMLTVEDVFEHLTGVLEKLKDDTRFNPILYIIDSLDALSDRAEQKQDMDKGTYGAQKAKMLSQMFRRVVQALEKKRVHLMIISQVRDNIGVMFGKKYSRSGGRALDFYASHIIYLAQVGTVKRTVNKITRTIGVEVKAKAEKNKIGPPLRDVQFPIRFGFGIDDVVANAEWLDEIGRLNEVDGFKGNLATVLKRLEDVDDDTYQQAKVRLRRKVKECWDDVEQSFAPTRSKYSTAKKEREEDEDSEAEEEREESHQRPKQRVRLREVNR